MRLIGARCFSNVRLLCRMNLALRERNRNADRIKTLFHSTYNVPVSISIVNRPNRASYQRVLSGAIRTPANSFEFGSIVVCFRMKARNKNFAGDCLMQLPRSIGLLSASALVLCLLSLTALAVSPVEQR